MAASSDDAFYSAPDSSPSNSTFSQDHQQHLSTPPNPNPNSGANNNQRLVPPSPNKWLSRMATNAGKVISSVLGLSDGCTSDDVSDGDVVEMLGTHEDKYEFDENMKKLNQDTASGHAEEPKAITPLTKPQELIPQENLSREQSEKPINPIPSLVLEPSSPLVKPKIVSSQTPLLQVLLSTVQASLEIHRATLAEANKSSEENKTTSSNSKLPLHPSTFPAPGQTQQLPPTETKPPLNSNTEHFISPGQKQPLPFSDIIQPVNPLRPISGKNQQSAIANIRPPINPLPSLSLNKNQQQPSHSAPVLNPNVTLSSTNQKQISPHSSIPSAKRHSKPYSKRSLSGPKCPLTSNHKEVHEKETPDLTFDPMVEEGSGAKRAAGNLKEVIELLSGDLDAKQFADVDLLDVFKMKGIVFEDPSWWSN